MCNSVSPNSLTPTHTPTPPPLPIDPQMRLAEILDEIDTIPYETLSLSELKTLYATDQEAFATKGRDYFELIEKVSKTYQQESYSGNTLEFYPNRYSDVLTTCANRIDVKGRHINASPIVLGGRRYLAAQAPPVRVMGDFFRMLRDQQVQTIVVLAMQAQGKLDDYWTEKRTLDDHWGDDPITYEIVGEERILSERECDGIVHAIALSTLRIGADQEVKVYHYKNWPDRNVPNITLFNELIGYIKPPSDSPLLIHCSAGIGRTGVTLMVDALARYINETNSDELPVMKFLLHARALRPGMIQNIDQFLCVLQTLVER